MSRLYAVCCPDAVLKCGQWQDGQREKDTRLSSDVADCGGVFMGLEVVI